MQGGGLTKTKDSGAERSCRGAPCRAHFLQPGYEAVGRGVEGSAALLGALTAFVGPEMKRGPSITAFKPKDSELCLLPIVSLARLCPARVLLRAV